jgi:hypothetical protein
MKVAHLGAYQRTRATSLVDCIMAALSTQRTNHYKSMDGVLWKNTTVLPHTLHASK